MTDTARKQHFPGPVPSNASTIATFIFLTEQDQYLSVQNSLKKTCSVLVLTAFGVDRKAEVVFLQGTLSMHLILTKITSTSADSKSTCLLR